VAAMMCLATARCDVPLAHSVWCVLADSVHHQLWFIDCLVPESSPPAAGCATFDEMVCRLRLKMVARITMDDLVSHLSGTLAEWPAKQLQALEIILNSPFINHPKLLYISRTLFPSEQRAESVGNGGEAWIGYKQDFRPCQYGLMLTIEPSFSVFYEGKAVVDYCQAVLTKGRQEWQWTADMLTDKEMREVSKELKGLTVCSAASAATLLLLLP
jgi:hypothetical protein